MKSKCIIFGLFMSLPLWLAGCGGGGGGTDSISASTHRWYGWGQFRNNHRVRQRVRQRGEVQHRQRQHISW